MDGGSHGRGPHGHDRKVGPHLLEWQVCDRKMIYLTEIDCAFRASLQTFTQKLGNTRAIEGSYFRTDVTVVQHARFVNRHGQQKLKPVVV